MCKNSEVYIFACEAGQSKKPLDILLGKYFFKSNVTELKWKGRINPKTAPWAGDDYDVEECKDCNNR